MTAQQTSVSYQAAGFAGSLVDASEADVRSYKNEDTTEMAFGTAVAFGTDADRDVEVCDAQADVIAGVVVHSHAYAKTTELGTTGLKQNVTVGVLREGVIRVYVSEAVAVGDAVRIRIDTNAGSDELLGPGTFCTTANGAHTIQVTAGMKWLRGASGGGYAELAVDMMAFTKSNDS